MPAVYAYLISAGVGCNSYADDLLDCAGKFVDSKKATSPLHCVRKRQCNLRASSVGKGCPHQKGIQEKPCNGFCPSPESSWSQCEWHHLESLDTLLCFSHVECKPFLDALQPQSRSTILANIDVNASETFWNAYCVTTLNKRTNVPNLQELLFDANAKLFNNLLCPNRP